MNEETTENLVFFHQELLGRLLPLLASSGTLSQSSIVSAIEKASFVAGQFGVTDTDKVEHFAEQLIGSLETARVQRDGPGVCFSGESRKSRGTYVKDANAAGWAVRAQPTANVSILVIGQDHSLLKVQKAERLGIRVMDYDEWEKTIVTGEV